MSNPTTTVKLDLSSPADFVYETAITGDVLEAQINRGRQEDMSQAQPGTCQLLIANDDGAYTPKGAGAAPLHPLQGVEVATSAPSAASLFTGFIRRIVLEPRGDAQACRVDCADWLWVLSRIDVSRPLMRDVQSGILMHRIVDLAEVGEHCDNTRVRDDTTDWSAIATGTIARDTTAPILEGPASLKVTGAAAGDGARYAIPHEGDDTLFQSLKVTARVYVINDGGTESDVILRLVDSATDPIASSSAVTLSSSWQVIEVTGTFGAAATDFWIDIEQDGAGARTFRVGAVHIVFYKSAVPRNFDTGQSTFAYVAPRRVNALDALQEAAENELGGWVYVDGAGTLQFEDRHHRWAAAAHTSSQGTINETMVDVPYVEDAEDLVGLVELRHVEWEQGTAGSIVFSLYPVPRAVPPSGTLTLDIDYGAIVRDHIVPVANTDWTAGSTPEGGDDESGNLTLAFDDYGGGAQAVFTNGVARTIWLTSFQVRGTPVRIVSDTPQVSYTPSSPPDIASKLRFWYGLQDKRPAVQAWAEYLGDRHVTQQERLPVALVNRTDAILTLMLARKLSERVTITADNTDYSPKVNGDYYIESIEHRLSQGATLVDSVWVVMPVDEYYWILGTGELGDAQSLSTTTAVGP